MAIEVSEAVELVYTILMLGYIKDIVEVVTADPDPNKFSVKNIKTIFLFKHFYFFL